MFQTLNGNQHRTNKQKLLKEDKLLMKVFQMRANTKEFKVHAVMTL